MGPVEAVPLSTQSSEPPPTFSMQALLPSGGGEMTVKLAVRPLVTVSVVDRLPANEPVMTTGVEAVTVLVVTVNVAVVFPVATVTVGGTTTSVGLALVSTTAEAAVAVCESVTVP